jgi:hypothetical protein
MRVECADANGSPVLPENERCNGTGRGLVHHYWGPGNPVKALVPLANGIDPSPKARAALVEELQADGNLITFEFAPNGSLLNPPLPLPPV